MESLAAVSKGLEGGHGEEPGLEWENSWDKPAKALFSFLFFYHFVPVVVIYYGDSWVFFFPRGLILVA